MKFLEAIHGITPFLKSVGFQHEKSEDFDMHKYAKFSNESYSIEFYYDRGEIELVASLNGHKSLEIL